MDGHWARDAIFYHVYPLGMCGAPARNRARGASTPRLAQVAEWIPHWLSLGVNAVYLGPLFESETHGYDTVDYFRVDRRLGDNATLAELVRALHAAGIRVILDAVYNHVGRAHPAFQDVVRHGKASRYCAWFSGLRFDERSPCGDPFTYDTWNGAYELVKLDLTHPEVRQHLLDATETWIREFDVDGLRLDAADCLDPGFLRELRPFCRARKPDFWLMGEVVFGDYTRWANAEMLDAVTNYEAYHALHASHNDRNYPHLAHTLQRQFGPSGLYKDLPLYAFVDNHDVNRIASQLKHEPHLAPLHVLLFTMPGVPSIYYGSEWALPGEKAPTSDAPLRPALAPPKPRKTPKSPKAPESQEAPQVPLAPAPPAAKTGRGGADLTDLIARLSRLRRGLAPLRHGAYEPLGVAREQFAFARRLPFESVVVAINGADAPARMALELPMWREGWLVDVLNDGQRFPVRRGRVELGPMPAHSGRVLVPQPH